MNSYDECRLCPHGCGVNRNAGEVGRCGMTSRLMVARASLHMWEEPPISGQRGSGTVFFSGCPLGCVYCQNREISHEGRGECITETQLANCFLTLEKQGAHNINLVTATHFLPTVISALQTANAQGLTIPIVYNTSGYETKEAISALSGLVDIYLTDFRYIRDDTAEKLSFAPDYPKVAKEALAEMFHTVGEPQFDKNGMMQKGIIVRLLLLPGHLIEAKMALNYLVSTYHNSIYLSLMNQYTPMPNAEPPLDRKVTEREYRSLIDHAVTLGVTNAFVQDASSASPAYIPPFSDKGFLL